VQERLSKLIPEGRSWHFIWIRLGLFLLWPVAVLLVENAVARPDLTERWYSLGIYPYLAQGVSAVFGWMPFSAAEWILYLGGASLVIWLCLQAYRLCTRPYPWYRLARTFTFIASLFGVMYFLFYALWGFNYSRLPLEETLQLPDAELSTALLREVCDSLIAEASHLRPDLHEDESGCLELPEALHNYLKEVNGNYNRLSEDYPGLWGTRYGTPKTVAASRGMSYADISGIFIPFTNEANINSDTPDLLQLSAASHEGAHQRGIAREDEANFMAYASCIKSDNPYFRYSGTMMAIIYCMNALYADDFDQFSEAFNGYTNGMRRDLAQHNAYWKQFEGPVQETSNKMNDTYLKSNNQSEGVKSYNRVVTLILKAYIRAH